MPCQAQVSSADAPIHMLMFAVTRFPARAGESGMSPRRCVIGDDTTACEGPARAHAARPASAPATEKSFLTTNGTGHETVAMRVRKRSVGSLRGEDL